MHITLSSYLLNGATGYFIPIKDILGFLLHDVYSSFPYILKFLSLTMCASLDRMILYPEVLMEFLVFYLQNKRMCLIVT